MILVSLCLAGILYCILMLFKVENAYKNQLKILNAIHRYAKESNNCEKAILMLHCMEDMNETLFRLTDWGCKRILPNEYYQEIKPYIQ